MVSELQERVSAPGNITAAAVTSASITGTSRLMLVCHRSAYDKTLDAQGQSQRVDQKSPNGIIPTLRNLFQEEPGGSWISWREAAEGATIWIHD